MNLQTPVTQLSHVSKKLERQLKILGIRSVQDILFYLPFRYEDYSKAKLIKDLQAGEQITIRAKVEIIETKRSWKRRRLITEAIVSDESGRMKIIWFGQPFVSKVLKVGDTVYFSGRPESDKLVMQMTNPNYEKETFAKASGAQATTHTARIVPMYHLTSGISHKQMRFLMSKALSAVKEIKEWLSEEILEKADLIPLPEAARGIHFPVDNTDLEQARKRLKFGELFILQLRAEMIRQSLKRSSAPVLQFKREEIKKFVDSLPFKLTKAQKVSAWEILKDIGKSEPMNRLLEGDVGSGKTVVAAMAMYNAILNGYQAVMMAPTEVLAQQHFYSLSKLLGSQVCLGLLTRSSVMINDKMINDNTKSKKKIIEYIKNGKCNIIIGTHALLSENVEFHNLGLAIVDEQHRFGVEQRKMLSEKTKPPRPALCGAPLLRKEGTETSVHFLSMTATPIPRSFALVLYGDLDLSIINEMPAGRKPVQTRLIPPEKRNEAYQFIREQVKEGRQVFVICPLITSVIPTDRAAGEGAEESLLQSLRDPSTSLRFARDDKKSVISEYEKLSKQIFPDLKVGYLHGKLKSKEKEEAMKKFREREIDILVSTSVVEVGVDIPNASVMFIEGAERFGLAQLHQFRGRVGRAEYQSYCLLFADTDSAKAMERLNYFVSTTDGFKVAEYDLQARGPGEVYGTAQSGLVDNLRLATLRDIDLIKLARTFSRGIDFAKYPQFRDKVGEWEKGTHLE